MTSKFKIVVSDLHMGAGRAAEGNVLEDFSDPEFVEFLDEIAAESEREAADVELIVNGDALEMLEAPHTATFDPRAVYRPEEVHSSSEADSAIKVGHILAGHSTVFQALGRFIQAGPPQRSLVFIKGNHDLNLHWPAVQDEIRRTIGADGETATLLSFEEWRIRREGIHVEHGNQYADILSRVRDMVDPRDVENPEQLALPIGSWLEMDVMNEVERDRPWVDGVKPTLSLVWYALAYDFRFAARAIATLIRALPGWAEEAILAPREDREDLVRQLEDPARVEEIGDRYGSDAAFRAWFNAEVVRTMGPLPPLPGAAGADVGARLGGPDAVAIGDRIREQVRLRLSDGAQRLATEEGAELVVFGHTHDAGAVLLRDGGTYVNSGTWISTVVPAGADKEYWRELFEHPERLRSERLLSYVRIDYDDAGQPVGQLLAYKPSGERNPTLASVWQRIVCWFRRVWRSIARRGGKVRAA